MDVHEVLLPNVQLVGIFDWSMGHAKYPDDALVAHKLKSGYVSKHPHTCRNTTIPPPPQVDAAPTPAPDTMPTPATMSESAATPDTTPALTTAATATPDTTSLPTPTPIPDTTSAPTPTTSPTPAPDATTPTPTPDTTPITTVPDWCYVGARVKAFIPNAGSSEWSTVVLAVHDGGTSRRRGGIQITVKKPTTLEDKLPDFRCNGRNENEIVVPLVRANTFLIRKDTSVITPVAATNDDADANVTAEISSSTTINANTSTTPPASTADFQYPSMVEFPKGSGEFINYAKPVGSTQHGKFLDDDYPPYFTITEKMPNGAPRYDTEMTIDGVTKLVPGYVGKSKDAGTYLLERGALDLTANTVHHITKLNVHRYRECQCQTSLVKPCCRTKERVFLLSQQPDFLNQRSCLEELFFNRGHLLLFGVKCHPEIAGLGIEYLWGEYVYYYVLITQSYLLTPCLFCYTGHSKQLFRNRYNDEQGKHLESNVRKSMATPGYNSSANPLAGTGPLKDRDGELMLAPMSQSLVCRFARRTRNYERIYERFTTPGAMQEAANAVGCSGYELMEKLYNICSVTSACHRSTFDQEKTLLANVERRNANAFAEDAVHEHSDFTCVANVCGVDERV